MFLFFLNQFKTAFFVFDKKIEEFFSLDWFDTLIFFLILFSFKIFFEVKYLLMLISLEFLSVSMIFFFYVNHQIDTSIIVKMIVIFSFLVAEAVLGLCLFILSTRLSGKDKMRSMSKNN